MKKCKIVKESIASVLKALKVLQGFLLSAISTETPINLIAEWVILAQPTLHASLT